MHDSIPRKRKLTEEDDYQRPRKANEYLQMLAGTEPPAMLFDEFWREGELALLFGPTGNGKSLLAMQLAEALARGRPIDGFHMPMKRQRVLYVDLKLSDRQFKARYKSYLFSANLFRSRPVKTARLCDWLRETIAAERVRCIVIDDLSAIRQSCDGTRETLKLMRELSALKDELDVSILVLTDCREPRSGTAISERDMMRSRILCDAADSVFAIAAHPSCPYSRTILQTRSPDRQVWNGSNAPTCWIETTEDGLLGLVFDKRFRPQMDNDRARLICEIKRRYDAGETFRDMAPELNISPATASRLRKKWRPGLEPAIPVSLAAEAIVEAADTEFEDDETEAWEEDDLDEPDTWNDGETARDRDTGIAVAASQRPALSVSSPPSRSSTPKPPSPDTPRSILLALGFRRTYDKNDREIFVEREDENGNRYVWYRFDSKDKLSPKDKLSRIEFKGVGTTTMRVDGPICLFNTS